MNESRFNRGTWVVLCISISLLGIILALNLYRYRLPTDGWVYVETGGLTENVLGLPSAIQPGDMPVSLDGLPIDGVRGTRPETWHTGGTVRYTIQREGQTTTIPVPIGAWTLSALGENIHNDWRSYLVGLCYFAIGTFVFVRRPGNPAAQALLFLGTVRLSMTIVFIVPETLADGLDPLVRTSVAILGYYIWGILLFPTLLLLSLIFPKFKRPFRIHPRLTVVVLYSLLPVIIILIGGPFAELGPFFGFGLVAVYGLLTVISVIHTLITERNDPVARVQIRWVGFGVALVGGYQFLTNIISFISTPLITPWWDIVDPLVYLTLPMTVGIAIMRYRLFDIDIIIRRTLQYAILTGLLALVYFGSIVLLQSLVENMTGEQSPIVVVISTLAIVALFNPLWLRVQAFIDRRFYREKYDAGQALARFAATARDEVDVDRLTGALMSTVEETLRPRQAILWLADGARRRTSKVEG